MKLLDAWRKGQAAAKRAEDQMIREGYIRARKPLPPPTWSEVADAVIMATFLMAVCWFVAKVIQ